jgi:hypothetical protein
MQDKEIPAFHVIKNFLQVLKSKTRQMKQQVILSVMGSRC